MINFHSQSETKFMLCTSHKHNLRTSHYDWHNRNSGLAAIENCRSWAYGVLVKLLQPMICGWNSLDLVVYVGDIEQLHWKKQWLYVTLNICACQTICGDNTSGSYTHSCTHIIPTNISPLLLPSDVILGKIQSTYIICAREAHTLCIWHNLVRFQWLRRTPARVWQVLGVDSTVALNKTTDLPDSCSLNQKE